MGRAWEVGESKGPGAQRATWEVGTKLDFGAAAVSGPVVEEKGTGRQASQDFMLQFNARPIQVRP